MVVEPGRRTPIEIEAVLAPDEGAPGIVDLQITDQDGNPVEGARVLVDGKPYGATASGGTLEISALPEGEHRVEISADTYQTVEETTFELGAGETALPITLRRMPGTVKVVARGPEGPVDDAVARWFGPSRLPASPLGEDGERSWVLRPGDWQVLVSSARYGIQQREVAVPEDATELITVEVNLLPDEEGTAQLDVRVVDVDGVPVDGAELFLDGSSLGKTSSGGAMRLQNLTPGQRELRVSADHFRDVEPVQLVLVDGLQEEIVTLEWMPGTVKVVAKGPEGAVLDATARFSGPSVVQPAALGTDGEEFFTLAEGNWQALVSSPTYGLQARSFVIEPDSTSLVVVYVGMSASEGGVADLNLTIVDPLGNPVDGADVRLDGNPLGATTNTGNLGVQQLGAGTRTLEVEAPAFRPKKTSVTLRKGSQDVTVKLDWAPGAVKVVTRSADGPVTDAVVRFAGPSVKAPMRVDDDGTRITSLEPGEWQALVRSASYGMQQQAVSVTDKDRGLKLVEFVLSPVVAGQADLLVRVQDIDGIPIEGASVTIDGSVVGTTSAGGLLLASELDPGSVRLSVTKDDYQASGDVSVDVAEGANERIIAMDWVPAELTVTVNNQVGQPVSAKVAFDGPVELDSMQTGSDGLVTTSLRPGTWTVVASTLALGPKSETIVLEPGAKGVIANLTLEDTRVEMTGDQVKILEKVHFDLGQATLRPESDAVLQEVANSLLGSGRIVKVEVQGHTDSTGSLELNQSLSQLRAEAVVADLVRRGVAPERLVAQGYGPTRAIAGNDSEAGRQKNRRVQFEILEMTRK